MLKLLHVTKEKERELELVGEETYIKIHGEAFNGLPSCEEIPHPGDELLSSTS